MREKWRNCFTYRTPHCRVRVPMTTSAPKPRLLVKRDQSMNRDGTPLTYCV